MGRGEAGAWSVIFRIIITPTALTMLKDIADCRIQAKIATVIDKLAEEPEKQGKPLGG